MELNVIHPQKKRSRSKDPDKFNPLIVLKEFGLKEENQFDLEVVIESTDKKRGL
jgi:hypothetical protein